MRDLIVDLSLRERLPLAEREVYGKKVLRTRNAKPRQAS